MVSKFTLMSCVFLFLSTPVFGSQDKVNTEYKKALDLFQQKKYSDAEKIFSELSQNKNLLQEYQLFYLGMSLFEQQKWAEASNAFNKVMDGNPSIKLKNDSALYLGKIALELKSYQEAKKQFLSLERKARNSEQYPEIIFQLAAAEKGLESHKGMCQWLNKLYSRYPDFSRLDKWGEDLAANEFLSEPTKCSSDVGDFRSRIRHFLFAGMDKRAQAEVDSFRKKVGINLISDAVQAAFFAQEGEVGKALTLLKPYYEKNKNNYDFLMQFASVAARAGESQLAVGAYFQAHKLQPNSKGGQQALYQSAFLSYMFQDYDGATRRFQEFQRKYPKSGLQKDARWHLAWLKYLKGDFEGSYRAMVEMEKLKSKNKRQWRGFPNDRLTYWMAMSLVRQGKTEQARPMLESLARDPYLGYYSLAAQARISKLAPVVFKVSNGQPLQVSPTRSLARHSSSEMILIPSLEDNFREEVEVESESEEALAQIEMGEEEEEAPSIDNPDRPLDFADSDGGPSDITFSSPLLNLKLDRARALVAAGQSDWARWDFFEIESKTRNQEHLRALMAEYSKVEHYHRSSYIAQVKFGSQRASYGIEGVRYLWEFAYPRAYSQYVEPASKDYLVPQELIWGIMKAESAYRKDAISPVGALGLMQVMPFTGYRVAQMLNEKDFTPRQLLQAEYAVKLGTRYLKRLMDKFENTTPLVAAGYNAGPHRVNMWLQNFGKLDTDEFIEHIPFLETRNYVKKVMGNMHVYSQLYNGGKDLFPYLAGPLPVQAPKSSISKENWDDI
ncbi:MAG: transglycosylase SLT domain-containing protein [Bdellovibrionia bacterium]